MSIRRDAVRPGGGRTERRCVRPRRCEMTTTLHPTDDHARPRTRAPYGRLLLVNLGATVAAGVAAEAWIGIVRAAGVELRVGDPFGDASSAMALPTGACATSIAMCMVLGTALAVGAQLEGAPAGVHLRRRRLRADLRLAGRRRWWRRGRVRATKFTLIVAHLIAAAVIVPLVARCLARRREPRWFRDGASAPPQPAAARTTCRSGASPFDLRMRGSRRTRELRSN